MTDIPIIFSAAMVRALLEGRKTMTRRIMKAPMPPAPAMDAINPKNVARHPAPYFDAYCSERKDGANPRGMSRNWCWWTRDDRQCLPTINVRFAPGDRLWVRENFARNANQPSDTFMDTSIVYAADGRGRALDNGTEKPWTSCIHMPRRLSRLTLIVTGVKVERLQDISEEDARAEGVEATEFWRDHHPPSICFSVLWNALHGAGSWHENPYVIALSFHVIKANIDAPEARIAA